MGKQRGAGLQDMLGELLSETLRGILIAWGLNKSFLWKGGVGQATWLTFSKENHCTRNGGQAGNGGEPEGSIGRLLFVVNHSEHFFLASQPPYVFSANQICHMCRNAAMSWLRGLVANALERWVNQREVSPAAFL